MRLLIVITSLLMLTACSMYDPRTIDVSKKNPVCVRECSARYSKCIGDSFGSAAAGCYSAYDVCASTCN